MTSPLTYPLDITGSSPSNLISGEEHQVEEMPYLSSFLILPDLSPFFGDSVNIQYSDGINPARQLILGTDYTLVFPYWGATRSIGKPVYGAILLNDSISTGAVSLQYQTLGGPWEENREVVADNILAMSSDPRNVIWDVLSNVTNCFPTTNNSMVIDTSSGLQQFLDSLYSLADTIANAQPTKITINGNTY